MDPKPIEMEFGFTLLNISDVAKLCGVSRDSIYTWLADGTMPQGMKLGRRMLWPRRTIYRWLAGEPIQESGSVAAATSEWLLNKQKERHEVE